MSLQLNSFCCLYPFLCVWAGKLPYICHHQHHKKGISSVRTISSIGHYNYDLWSPIPQSLEKPQKQMLFLGTQLTLKKKKAIVSSLVLFSPIRWEVLVFLILFLSFLLLLPLSNTRIIQIVGKLVFYWEWIHMIISFFFFCEILKTFSLLISSLWENPGDKYNSIKIFSIMVLPKMWKTI